MSEKLVEVHWLDAGAETLQLTEEEAKLLSPMPRKNVGYLIVDDAEKITLGFGYIRDREKHGGLWDIAIVIPKGIVTSITELQ